MEQWSWLCLFSALSLLCVCACAPLIGLSEPAPCTPCHWSEQCLNYNLCLQSTTISFERPFHLDLSLFLSHNLLRMLYCVWQYTRVSRRRDLHAVALVPLVLSGTNCSSDVSHRCGWRLLRELPCENKKSGSLIAPRFPFSCQHFLLVLGLHPVSSCSEEIDWDCIPNGSLFPIICICFDQSPWSKVMRYLGNREPFVTQTQPFYRRCCRNAGSSWHFHECID